MTLTPFCTIRIHSHYFTVTDPNETIKRIIFRYTHQYVSMEWTKVPGKRNPVLKPSKVFASKSHDNREFRFIIGQLDGLLEMFAVNDITPDLYCVVIADVPVGVSCNINLNPAWVLKDYQLTVKDFILEDIANDYHSRLVAMPTGTGKTVTSLAAIAEIKQRTAIVILLKFSEKWCSDISEILDVKPAEIMMVQGTRQLKGLIDLAKDDLLDSKFIILTISTLQNFYKAYESGEDVTDPDNYNCSPDDLFNVLGVGTVIIDETHCHMHAVFKTILYTHVNKLIALSATFISEDPLVQRMQRLMFPKEVRFDSIKMEKYIKVFPISYHISKELLPGVRHAEYGSNVYSHNAFEVSILKNPKLLTKYLDLIAHLVTIGYLDDYLPGDKLAVFAYRTDLCDHITRHLINLCPHLDVRRYVKEDPYENAIEPDIRVSTILSLGTAIDIPNLRTVVMTTNVSSEISNRQTLGRLRKLKDRDVKFYYLYCTDVKKQVEYHAKKLDMFRGSVASISSLVSPINL